MWNVTIKRLLTKKVRVLMTGLAVMLGVAFVSGTLVLTDTISRTFDNLFTDIYQHTDAAVRERAVFGGNNAVTAGRGRLPASVVGSVKRAPGVAAADGTITGIAQIVDKKNKPVGDPAKGAPVLGFNWLPDAQLRTLRLVEGKGPESAGEIVIDKKSADDTGYKVGATVPVLLKTGRESFKLTGIAKFGNANSPLGASIVAFTTSEAERVLGEPGKLDTIDVAAKPGVSQQQLVRNIEQVIKGEDGGKLEVLTGKELTRESQTGFQQGLKFFNYFLLVFGLVALLVGGFIIFNTFSILVTQRAREMALLRAIGAGARQVLSSVLFEAVVVGLIASLLGVVGGVVLALGLKALLGVLNFDIPAGGIVLKPRTVAVGFAVGLGFTVVAAVAPAIKAARVPPVAAMRDISIDTSGRSLRRTAIGSIVTALGILALVLGLLGGGSTLVLVGVGAVVIFMGVAILGPLFARPVADVIGTPIAKLRGMTGSLARENAMRSPKRTSATAAALMIGVGLVVFITIAASSIKSSIESTVTKGMKADYVIDSGQFHQGGFSPKIESDLQKAPGVTAVSGVRDGQVEINGSVKQVTAYDTHDINRLFEIGVTKGNLAALPVNGVAVQKDVASDKNWKVGTKLAARFASTGKKTLVVGALYSERYPTGSYLIDTKTYAANFADQFDVQVYVKTAGGANAANRAAIKKVLNPYPGAKLQDRSQFAAAQTAQINPLLSLIYALLALAVIIALFGIGNTLGLSIIERTHELGLLRAVGMTRSQMRATVRWESVIIALFGTLLGLLIGLFFGWVMVEALKSQGFTEFSVPAGQLALIVVLGALAGVLAAIVPARRAARLDVLQAITTE
ncbi:MAG TPA: FtsX-like permease family protein [Acidimicrobiia bacterium]|nr:FtsX-like permease family protein [Acidimicrobiia bacterium]